MNLRPTGELRWFHKVSTIVALPEGTQRLVPGWMDGTMQYDYLGILQQEFVNVQTGEKSWHDVHDAHEDREDAEARVKANNDKIEARNAANP